jgi:hypothetical protein
MVGPLGGCWRQVRQRPPPKLKTLMAGPLGVLAADPIVATSEVGDVDGEPPGGCWRQAPAAATTKVEDIDGGPLGVLMARSNISHHRS